jgi:secreted Zn-dependent insulinase-like peptidase
MVGFTDKFLAYVSALLDTLSHVTQKSLSETSIAVFESKKRLWLETYDNVKYKRPIKHCMHYNDLFMETKALDNDEIRDALSEATPDDLQTFAPKILKNMFLEVGV